MKRKIQNNIIFAVFIVSGLFGLCFGAGEFDSINSTVQSLDQSGKTSVAVGFKWFMGWLPVILFVGIGWAGYYVAKKKADQKEDDTTKVAVIAIISAFLGFIAGVFVDAIIGAGLMGDASKGLQVLRQFWSTILGV